MSSDIDGMTNEPRTVDEARDEVERSRQRISHTLDALEGRIVDKKHELREKANVLRPVRDRVKSRPFTAVAIALGAGLLLGSLGGGSVERERTHGGRVRGRRPKGDDRQELREWRRQRRERLKAVRDRYDEDDDGSRFDDLKHQLKGALTTAITGAITARVREFARNAGNGRSGGHRR